MLKTIKLYSWYLKNYIDHFPPLPLIVLRPRMSIPALPLPRPPPLPILGGGVEPSNLPAA